MYVLFPADEVVYLSYGRLIYVPTASSPEPPSIPGFTSPNNRTIVTRINSEHIPRRRTRSSLSTASANFFKKSNKQAPKPTQSSPNPEPSTSKVKSPTTVRNSLSTVSHTSSYPSTSTGSTKSRKSTASEPIFSSPKSNPTVVKSSSFKADNPETPPVRPERKKKGLKLPVFNNITRNSKSPERKLSYSDFLALNRENRRSEEPNSSNDKKTQREKSPGIRKFFRDKSVPRNLGRDRTPFDFDTLFNREPSPGKLSVQSLQVLSRQHSNTGGSEGKGKQVPRTPTPNRVTPEKSSPTKKKAFFGSVRVKARPQQQQQQQQQQWQLPETELVKMASNESALKELTHPGYNEQLKAHNAVAFKLVRTVSDFTQQLGQMYEQHAEELQMLVANFRKRNGELRKERPACPSSLFHTWETLLQEVEIDSQALGDIASILGRSVSRPILEKSFYRKIQSRKVFTHREGYETIIAKTEEKLAKCRQEYKTAYLSYLSAPSTDTLSAYFNSHNAYVQQLHATNGMMEEYGKETLPSLLQELEEIYSDLCSTVADAILQGAEVVSARAMEQCRRYDGLVSQSKAISGPSDLAHLARSLPAPPGRGPVMKRIFVPPQPPPPPDPVDGEPQDLPNDNIPPPLKDELVIDRLSALQVKPSHDVLRKEAVDLEAQIRQIQDALDTLLRIQQRSVEANLYNKANELQEDISLKRFDLRVAQIHLSAINAQKELFTSKLEGDTGRDRKMSSASTGSMKNKWLKAFKSLKTPPPETEKKNGSAATRELLKGDPDAHNFQEYTYKKITPCDVCSQVLRGHTRQGLKCRICKMNVHFDCQDKASKCQTKARLLRRQKSTSEIETRVPEATAEEEKCTEVDQIYQVLKQATEISNSKPRVNVEAAPTPPGITVDRSGAVGGGNSAVNSGGSGAGAGAGVVGSNPGSSGSSGQSLNRRGPPIQPSRAAGSTLAVINPAPCSTSSAPHSPRRQKLNLRMKSLSLDSPESTEHVQRRKHHGANAASDPHSNQSSSSRIQSPSSPVHNRRLLSAKNIRMSSVELPDDNEKSPSSASTSPCPSPVSGKKSHRLLPTNLYVVLYNFKSRHQDELDLKAGYKVTVIDTSDPDWWKGKCLGRVGFFPSKYVSKLSPGEKPLQVTHNLQVTDGDNGLMLLRDQIVIQIGEEVDGMVMIRSGDNRQGVCPVKFLQEV